MSAMIEQIPAIPVARHSEAATPRVKEHLFDIATKATQVEVLPAVLVELLSTLPEGTAIYSVEINPAFGNTPRMPNGGYLASIILSACKTYMADSDHPEALSITLDYLKAARPGQAWVACTGTARGASSFTDLSASMYQVKQIADLPAEVVHLVRSNSMFGLHDTFQGPTTLPQHYSKPKKIEDVPVPHPRAWYLPVEVTMISQQLDLLIDLETQRRPFADYYIRFHPDNVVAQQHDASSDPAGAKKVIADNKGVRMAKGSNTLPMRSTASRRVDTIALPMFFDFRRPAMENVLKEDATSKYDEPTHKWAYPTLSLTIRFLRPVPDNVEWVQSSWRETCLSGRVISDVKIGTEDGVPLAIASMDSLMFDMRWFKL